MSRDEDDVDDLDEDDLDEDDLDEDDLDEDDPQDEVADLDDLDEDDFDEDDFDPQDEEEKYNEINALLDDSDRQGHLSGVEREEIVSEAMDNDMTLGEFAESLNPTEEIEEHDTTFAGKYASVCWGDPQRPLSDQTHQRCQECGWLKCEEGHCWCNMPPRKKAFPREQMMPYGVQVRHVQGADRCARCDGRPFRPCDDCKGSAAGCSACREGVTCCPACEGKGLFKRG